MKKGREYLSSLASSTKRNNTGQIRRTNFEGEKLQLFRGFLEVGLRHEVDIIGRKSFLHGPATAIYLLSCTKPGMRRLLHVYGRRQQN